MTTPIWFLDVDGVINAAGADLPDHLIRTEAVTAGTTWTIHYSPDVIEFINTIHRAGAVEIRWLTTWGADAKTSLAPAVGLDHFPAYDMYNSDDWWKAEIVADAIVHEGHPVIWTDDDLSTADIAELADAEVPVLAAAPVIRRGLTTTDLRRVAEFLRQVAPDQPIAGVPALEPGLRPKTALSDQGGKIQPDPHRGHDVHVRGEGDE